MSSISFVLRVETSRPFGEIVEAGLDLLEVDSSAWYDGDTVRFEFYAEDKVTLDSRRTFIEQCLHDWSDGETWRIEDFEVSDEDWSEYWKRFFHVKRVSRRMVIKPSWEAHTPQPEDITIEIDPGMSFGTGQHFSTSSCLQFMDEFLPPPQDLSFLDIGCGSGILSIAAAKLGFRSVRAFDNDPNAVRISKQNLQRNGVATAASCVVTDLETLEPSKTYEVVAANMLSDLLVRFSPAISGTVSRDPSGYLLLAGIMTPKYPDVKDVYEDLGFREIKALNDHEWKSGLFRLYAS